MWAVGVILHGFADGRFPFGSEQSARTKPVQCPPNLGADGENFLLAALQRDETMRLTADQALEHAFVSGVKSGIDQAVETAAEQAEAATDLAPDVKEEEE